MSTNNCSYYDVENTGWGWCAFVPIMYRTMACNNSHAATLVCLSLESRAKSTIWGRIPSNTLLISLLQHISFHCLPKNNSGFISWKGRTNLTRCSVSHAISDSVPGANKLTSPISPILCPPNFPSNLIIRH